MTYRALHTKPTDRIKRTVLDYDRAPFFICIILIYIPYFLFSANELFPIALLYGVTEHTLFGLLPVFIITAGAIAGWVVASRSSVHQGPEFYLRFNRSPLLRVVLWLITSIALVVQGAQLILGGIGYGEGGFIAARQAFDFPGVGAIIRLTLVTLPMLAFVSKERKILVWLIVCVSIANIIRAVIMSERNSLIEAACLCWVIGRLWRVRVPVRALLTAGIFTYLLFAFVLELRLIQQYQQGAAQGANTTTFLDSVSAYYADTMNKYYLVMDGRLKYPITMYETPFRALFIDRKMIASEYANYLLAVEGLSTSIASVLNNPGGLAEDVSDLGPVGGLAAVFIKFFLYSFVWRRSRESIFWFSMSTIILISILEYPRFNFLYLPFGFYLLVAAIVLGVFFEKPRLGKRRWAHVAPQSKDR